MAPAIEPALEDIFPVDWAMTQLSQLAAIKGGKRLPKGAVYSDSPTAHPYIRVTDFDRLSVRNADLKYISEDLHKQVSRYTISSDDVYISIAGTIGLVGTIPKVLSGANLTENAAKLVIRDRGELDNRFLCYWLASPLGVAAIRLRTTKTSQPKLALMRIGQIGIHLPPLAEQRRIAAVLNAIQDAIAAQEDVIAAARAFKRSLMHRLFTYGPGLVPAVTKETEIGEIPAHWKVAPIGSFARISSGTTPSRKTEHYWSSGTVPWVKTGEVNYCVITGTDESVTERAVHETSLRIYPVGTLLLAMYGQGITRGKVAILGIDATINQACAAISLFENQPSTAYIYHSLEYSYERLRAQSHGTQQLNLNAQLVGAFLVPIPPKTEQDLIAEYLSCLATKIAAEEDRKTALEALFKSMLYQLMTGQLRLLSDDSLPGLAARLQAAE